MASYESFAEVYDELMDEVPYGEWASRILELLRQFGIEDGLVLELGCGTGRMMQRLEEAGYDMIGVDSSEDMLRVAKETTSDSCLCLLQDMREFELYGTVAAVVSVCDSLNYITEEEDLIKVFRLVNNYLDPGGIFIFDINTEHKYRDVIGDTVIAEDRDDVSFIWYNEYDETEHRNYIDLSVVVREPDDRYRKFCETHVQTGYRTDQIRDLIRESGLIYLGAYDGYTGHPAREDSERVVFLAREQGKTLT